MPYEFLIYLAIVIVLSPILTAVASRRLLSDFHFGQRLILSLPQALIFGVAAILKSRSGLISNWELLTLFSIVFGQAIGFMSLNMIAKTKKSHTSERA